MRKFVVVLDVISNWLLTIWTSLFIASIYPSYVESATKVVSILLCFVCIPQIIYYVQTFFRKDNSLE